MGQAGPKKSYVERRGLPVELSPQFPGDNPDTSQRVSCKGPQGHRGSSQSPRLVQTRAGLRGDPCPPSKAAQRGPLPTQPGRGCARPHPTLPHAASSGPASKERLQTKGDEAAQVRRWGEAAPHQLPPSLPRSEMAQKPRPVPAAMRPRGAAAAVLLWRKLRLLLQSISHPITALFFF